MEVTVISTETGNCIGVLRLTPDDCGIYDPITGYKKYALRGLEYDEELVLPSLPSSDRVAYVPKNGAIVYDKTESKVYIGDGVTSGGVQVDQQSVAGLSSSITSNTSRINIHEGDIYQLGSRITNIEGYMVNASHVVSSLTSGAIVLEHDALPVAVKTGSGNLYYLEKGSVITSGGTSYIDPAPYLAYDGVSSFTGVWSVFFAGGGAKGEKGEQGISPAISVTQTSSGVLLYTSDAQGETSGRILNGSLTVPIQPYSSDSAYSALTCIAYNGGGYQVLSATSAGENPDNAASKFVCFASSGVSGSNGISPVLSAGSVTQLPAGSSASAEIILSGGSTYSLNLGIPEGQPGPTLIGASQIVSSLTSGAIVLEHDALPVAVKTDLGNLYYLEKGSVITSGGTSYIDPTPYLAYDGASSFSGPWTVYFAGGIPDNMPILNGGSAIVPLEHRAYQVPLSSGMVIGVNSSGLTSSVCVTQELWLDMPSSAVSFTLPSFTWIGGTPDFDQASTRFVITVRWNGTKFLACSAYQEALA